MKLAIAILAAAAGVAAAQTATTGAIEGRVIDAGGAPITGFTVRVVSFDRQQVETAITDRDGRFRITLLSPGVYGVYCPTGREPLTARFVGVDAGHTTAIVGAGDGSGGCDMHMQSAIDPSTAARGLVLDRDDLTLLPVAGTAIDGAFRFAPEASGDAYGLGFAGASSLENTYLLDGANIGEPHLGNLGLVVPHELVQTLDVQLGGWDASSPGALGAVVLATTRAGTDDYHGSVFATLAPSWLAAAPRTAPTYPATIEISDENAYTANLGVELSGPLVKHRAWFYAAFAPTLSRTDYTRQIRSQTDCRRVTGTGVSACDPQLADGQPDFDPKTGFPITEVVASEVREAPARAYTALGRIDVAPTPEQQGSLIALVVPQTYDQPGLVGPASTGTHTSGVTSNVTAQWHSKLLDDRVEIEGGLDWYHASQDVDPLDSGLANARAVTLTDATFAAIAPFESPAVVRACTDGGSGDRYPQIENCPLGTSFYTTGGPGTLSRATEDRKAAHVAVRGRVEAAGKHAVEAGLALENDSEDALEWAPGGAQVETDVNGKVQYTTTYVRLVPGAQNICSTPAAGGVARYGCEVVTANSPPIGQTTSRLAPYVRDVWEPLPDLRIDAGLRYERQRLSYASDLRDAIDPITGEHHGDVALDLHGVAPRAGASYDPTGAGRAKLYAHWGRYFEPTPLDLNAHALTIAPIDELTNLSSISTTSTERLIGVAPTRIAPGLGPQYGDELIAGGELALSEGLTAGVAYDQRSLGRIIEDASNDGANTYTLVNPGESPGFTQLDPARRDYRAVTIDLVERLGALFVRGSYTYARTEGNYPGLVSGDVAQPNDSPQYDLVELLPNRQGALPQDRPSRFTLDAYAAHRLGTLGELVVATHVVAVSGTPISALGAHYLYGADASYLLPQGSFGRTPFTTEIDAHVGFRRVLSPRVVLDVFVDVLNVLDDRTTYAVDQSYGTLFSPANPISGGSYRDLIWLKANSSFSGEDTNQPISRNPSFGKPIAYQAPTSARLGLRLSF